MRISEIYSSFRNEVWIFFASVIFFYIVKQFLLRKNFPPGPIGLPIVGYLPFLTRKPYIKFTELAKKYGDVFSLYMGSELIVVLNSAEAIREALLKREFVGRPPNTTASLLNTENPFFSNNLHVWQEQRRFVIQSMKDLGLGKSKIEGHIQEEIHHFLEVLKESKGKPMDLMKPLTPSMSNNICALVFGERYDYHDPARIAMDKFLESVGRSAGQTAIPLFFPWLIKIPFFKKFLQYDRSLEDYQTLMNFTNEKIRMHEKTLDPKDKRDFIDSYLIEMKSRTQDKETTFSENYLNANVLTLFGAGSETVRTTIIWCVYTMAAFPEVQKKVRQEIHDVLGSNRTAQLSDQNYLLYTQAVIREVMRWQTTVPLNLLRYTVEKTTVKGYDIPEGVIVIANFYAVHYDDTFWKDPESFQPERFINSDGTLKKAPNNYMPFSVGKRVCPGEAMAMMEVFLYFVSILQNFEVAFPKGYKATFDSDLGITNLSKPHKLCFLPD